MVETPGARPRKSKFIEEDVDGTSAVDASSVPSLRNTRSSTTKSKTENANGSITQVVDHIEVNPNANGNYSTPNGQIQKDPKIDHEAAYDFGGPLGVTAMMIGFPILMWYMWIGATYYDGKFPTRESGEGFVNFASRMGGLVYEGAFPTLQAWRIYWTFFILEGVLYCVMPGVWAYGKPLPHENNKQLPYWCSGVASFYTTILLMAIVHVTGLFPLYTLLDQFGPIMSVAICSGFLVSIVAYVSALARGAQHRMTGNHIYDFFMGAELNPRLFEILDFKMFFEVRLPWYILFGMSVAAAARQYEQYGYVSGEVWFLVMAHFLYANACSKGEECIVTTW